MKIAICFFVILSIVAPISLGRPMEIIFRGGDCQCAGPEFKGGCEHGALQGYGLGLIGSATGSRLNAADCSTPRFRIRAPENPVKYIFDYNLEIPIETSRIDLPLTGLFARVDKILVEKGSPKYVNSGCAGVSANAIGAAAAAACTAGQAMGGH